MEKQTLSAKFAAGFYLALTIAAYLFGTVLADLDLLVWHDRNQTTIGFDAALGTVAGLVVVVLSALLDRVAEWARRLSRAFAELLGKLTFGQIFVLAVSSSIGEELFFRGFLQQLFSERVFDGFQNGDGLALVAASVIFGAVHVGPDPRAFLPWTLMALVMGFALGGMYLYTGNVLAPILAHFTINFLNLSLISQNAAEAD